MIEMLPSPRRGRFLFQIAIGIALCAWGCSTTVTNEGGASGPGMAGAGGAPAVSSPTDPSSEGGGDSGTFVSAGEGGSTVMSTGDGGSGGASSLGACVGGAAPAADAVYATDPAPTLQQVGNTIILRKELSGWPNYGVADSAADVTYNGDVAAWTFQVPDVPFTSATVALSIVADDRTSNPIDAYYCQAWVGDDCLFGGQAPVEHGVPIDEPYTNWSELDLPATAVPGGPLVVTFANPSTMGFDAWLAIDWIELRLTTP